MLAAPFYIKQKSEDATASAQPSGDLVDRSNATMTCEMVSVTYEDEPGHKGLATHSDMPEQGARRRRSR